MEEFLWKNIGWMGAFLAGVISWAIYFVRQNDKLDRMATELDVAKRQNETFKTEMQKLTFDLTVQEEKLLKLETVTDKITDTLNELKSDVKVIASWVKLQSGNTLLKDRRDK